MTVTEKISVKIEAEIDNKSFQEAEKEISSFVKEENKRLASEKWIKLSLDLANLRVQQKQLKDELKKAQASWDLQQQVEITAKLEPLREQINTALAELKNFSKRWNTSVSWLDLQFKKVTDEIKKSRDALVEAWKSTKWLDNLISKAEDLEKQLKDWKITAQEATKQLEKINKTSLGWITWSVKNLFTAFIWFDLLSKSFDFIKDSVKYSAYLEQTRVSFENLTWSAEKAKKIIEDIQTFSNNTPFQFADVADSAKSLISIAWIAENQLIPTLTRLWDIAASQWKDISQVVEAYNDAIVWEFERLKEFWVRASVEWDKVKFTFKWQTTEIDKTSEAIWNYIFQLWEAEWVAWSMEKQSQTLNWKWSTLKDTIQSTGWIIADFFRPALIDLIDAFWVLISVLKLVWNWFTWFVQLALTALTWLIEWSVNIVKHLYNNWEIFSFNTQTLFSNLWKNLSNAFNNLPNAVAVVLKNTLKKFDWFITSVGNAFGVDISKKLWLWKIVDTLTTATSNAWFVDLKSWFKALPSVSELKLTKNAFNSFLDTSNDLANNFNDIKNSLSWIKKTWTQISSLWTTTWWDWWTTKTITTLNSLKDNLSKLQDQLWKTEIWTQQFKDLQKEIKNTEDKINSLTNTTKSWWWSSKVKTAEDEAKELEKIQEEEAKKEIERQEKMLKYFAQKEVEKVKQSEMSEYNKAKAIVKINEQLNKDISALNSKTAPDELSLAQMVIEKEKEKNEKIKDNLETLEDWYKKVWDVFEKSIDDSKKAIDELKDKITDTASEISKIDEELNKLETWRATTLWERNVEILERQTAIQKELNDLKEKWVNIWLASTIWENTLNQLSSWSVLWTDADTVANLRTVLELQKEQNSLLQEKRLIEANASKDELLEAQRINELSPTAKFLEDYNKEKEILDKKKILKQEELADFKAQKLQEETILTNLNNKKIEIDNNYLKLKTELEQQITDDLLSQNQTRIDSLKSVELQAIATAKALQTAWASSTSWSSSINNTKNVNVGWIIVNNQADLESINRTLSN